MSNLKLIEGDMRKKRAEKKIANIFNGPFIEDTPVPYLGFKKLVVAGDIRLALVPSHFPLVTTIAESVLPTNLTLTSKTARKAVNLRFRSPHNNQRWDPDNGIEAECTLAGIGSDSGDHNSTHIPHPRCTCGIYAFNLPWARQHLKHGDILNVLPINVAISMGGYCIPFSGGYRSSIAKIEAIVSDSTAWWVGESLDSIFGLGFRRDPKINARMYKLDISELAHTYHVPVIHPNDITDFAEEYKQRWGSG